MHNILFIFMYVSINGAEFYHFYCFAFPKVGLLVRQFERNGVFENNAVFSLCIVLSGGGMFHGRSVSPFTVERHTMDGFGPK